MCVAPMTTTSRITATFAITTTVSTRADSLVPVTISAVRISSSIGATRLTLASGPKNCATPPGRIRPKPSSVARKYADQTLATIAAAVTSSSTSAQPTSQAHISPNVT